MRKAILTISLIVSLLVPVYFAAAGLGARFGLWPWQFGLGTMVVQWGAIVCFVALGLAVIALIAALLKAPRFGGVVIALIAAAIPGLALGRLAGFGATAEALPPIHDVQTDWSNPIQFSDTLMQARSEALNPVLDAPVVGENAKGRWPKAVGRSNADLQAEAYAYVRPILVQVPPDATFDAVEAAVRKSGWDIVNIDRSVGQIEATATTQWFGFKDDVAVRISPQGQGARIDMRSVSRVGLSDLGANALRLKTLGRSIQLALKAPPEPELAGEPRPPAAPGEPAPTPTPSPATPAPQ
jgi:fatty-acyl-CoA synthase